ncbi:MAG: cell division protein SepF [Clostridia bacterium]|nr:cell division protein SepF [Clostridia bacterium]
MGFLDKMKNAIGLGDEEYYDEDDILTSDYEDEEPVQEERSFSRKNKVVNIHATTQLKVVVMQPENFEDAKGIADHLKTKKPVIINLESLDSDVARRVVDFLSGSVYGLDGNIQKVASGIFLIAPYNVSIMGDFKNELQSKGLFGW